MKKIVIVRGDEFKVYDNEIGKTEDIFEEIYEKALEQAKQLEQYGDRMQSEREEYARSGIEPDSRSSEYLNNVIAFCGERGQGKSTAMGHFIKMLEKENDGTHKKEILRVIDPTAMEMAHEIVDIIVSRLFEQFQKNRMKNESQDINLSRMFQKVHRNMSVLKNAKSFIEREYAYNGSLQNLTDIMESMEMREDIIRLVDLYLKYRGKDMLIIPIDDLDLNLDNVYQVAEQLRKYFMIPRVIIVMAVNIDQLTLCVERELLKDLKPLQESRRWNIWGEARNMSNRYMEKLIPFSRRLQLPDIHTIAEDGENSVEIVYRTRREELSSAKSMELAAGEPADETGGGQEENSILFDSKELGIEKGILNLIFRKTGLIYVAKPNEVHPIIPRTLRELVNLIALLGDMGENRADNLEAFEQYFCQIWLENNLSDENAAVVRKIAGTQLNDLHNDAFLLLYGIQEEKRKAFEKSLGEMFLSPLARAVEDTYQAMQAEIWTPDNGDLVNCLRLLRQGSKSDVSRLSMAVSTIFSIRMLKLEAVEKREILYDFVGRDLFGEVRLVRGKALENRIITDRMRFTYSVRAFLQSVNGRQEETWPRSVSGIKDLFRDESILAAALLFMGLFSDFQIGGRESGELVSNNNVVAENAIFDIGKLFLSGISWERIKEKISWDKWKIDESVFRELYFDMYRSETWILLACNMECLICLGQHLQDSRDIKEAAEEKDYYRHFIESIKRFLEGLHTYLNDLDVLEDKDFIYFDELFAMARTGGTGGGKPAEARTVTKNGESAAVEQSWPLIRRQKGGSAKEQPVPKTSREDVVLAAFTEQLKAHMAEEANKMTEGTSELPAQRTPDIGKAEAQKAEETEHTKVQIKEGAGEPTVQIKTEIEDVAIRMAKEIEKEEKAQIEARWARLRKRSAGDDSESQMAGNIPDSPVRCRQDTRFEDLQYRLKWMTEFLIAQNFEKTYENYAELKEEILKLKIEAALHDKQEVIGQELAKQYNDLRKAIVRGEQ